MALTLLIVLVASVMSVVGCDDDESGPPAHLMIVPDEITTHEGRTISLSVNVPVGTYPSFRPAYWTSSNECVVWAAGDAQMTRSMLLSAIRPGTSEIRVHTWHPGYDTVDTAFATVTVLGVTAISMSIRTSSPTVRVGDSISASVSVWDSTHTSLTREGIGWFATGDGVVSIAFEAEPRWVRHNPGPDITGVTTGTVTLTAEFGALTATAEVVILPR